MLPPSETQEFALTLTVMRLPSKGASRCDQVLKKRGLKKESSTDEDDVDGDTEALSESAQKAHGRKLQVFPHLSDLLPADQLDANHKFCKVAGCSEQKPQESAFCAWLNSPKAVDKATGKTLKRRQLKAAGCSIEYYWQVARRDGPQMAAECGVAATVMAVLSTLWLSSELLVLRTQAPKKKSRSIVKKSLDEVLFVQHMYAHHMCIIFWIEHWV